VSWENVLAFVAQVALWTAAGGVLPRLMRIRDPRVLLPYFQVLFLACVLLPVMQPWVHPVVIVDTSFEDHGGQRANSLIAVSHWPALTDLVLPALLCGATMRIGWLLLGLWRLSRYRRESILLEPRPASVDDAARLTGVEADVRLSHQLPGPVTFGAHRPIVLLPSQFAELPYAAQVSVVCHELLHVRRRDWLFGMCEELLASLLWFHPAVWWLAARIRLAREQAVDREVVALTADPDPYVDALLALATLRTPVLYAPAQPLLSRRHIVRRIESLMKGKEVPMSRRHLLSRYTLIAVTLAFTAWLSILTFPLAGTPQVREPNHPDAAGITVEAGGRLLHRTAVEYPEAARRNGISGTVILELSLAQDGSVMDGRVVSGPDELRAAALKSALDWHFQAGPPRVQVAIDYRLEERIGYARERTAATSASLEPREMAGPVSVDVSQVPQTLQAPLQNKLARYDGQQNSLELRGNVERDVAEVDSHLKVTWRATAQGVTIAPRLIGTTEAISSARPAETLADIPPTPGVKRLRIGGNVQALKIDQKVQPAYPALAKQARLQGTVRLEVLIDKTGVVSHIGLISGHPLLLPSAIEAVKQWTYRPTLLNGEPVEVLTTVDVNYTLAE
jgi:TonB family protein